MEKDYDIFLSYKRSDGVIYAKYLCSELSQRGYRVFLDLRELHTGRFDEQLKSAILSSRSMIFIVTPNYASSLENEPSDDNWTGKEVLTSLENYDQINIVPVTVSPATMDFKIHPEIAKFKSYEGIRYDPYNTREEEDTFFMKLEDYLQIRPAKNSYLEHVTQSGYSSSYKPETKRLKLQQQYSREIDMNTFSYVLEKLGNQKKLNALDFGCADGLVTKLRFGSFDRFLNVIGIDKNEDAVKSAENDDIFSFYSICAGNPDFEEKLKAVMKEKQIEAFDLVFSALTVHHLTNPVETLRILRKYISPHGAIILRGIDDGSLISYGADNLPEQSVELSMMAENMSDRYHGRKFYYQLLQSGFKNIKMFFTTDSTVGMDDDEREKMFNYYFKFRSDYTAKLVKANPNVRQYENLDNEMRTVLSKLHDSFDDEEIFVMMTTFAAVGFAD